MEAVYSATPPPPRERPRRPSAARTATRSGAHTGPDPRAYHHHPSSHVADRAVSSLTPPPQPPVPITHQSQHLQQPQQQQQQQLQQQPQIHHHQLSHQSSHLTHSFQSDTTARSSPAPSSTDSPRYRSVRDSMEEPKRCDSRQGVSATSTYLQEKLLRERKVENDRYSSRIHTDKMSASLDLRTIQSSPVRGLAEGRPRSSNGHTDPAKKKGVGLKEMEQTLTTLHKQNFDLKLELYHRREKQTALEERCETLETEKRELESINDKLMSELEMRDKAVEEAVAMIVSLEARLEQLLREREQEQERERDRQQTPDGRRRHYSDASLRRALSNALGDAVEQQQHQQQQQQHRKLLEMPSINRMPSFISERSENTENLRNLYLSRGGSLCSLPTYDGASHRIGSPSLSVLSESSFVSVYGRKKDDDDDDFMPRTSSYDGLVEVRSHCRSSSSETYAAAADDTAVPMTTSGEKLNEMSSSLQGTPASIIAHSHLHSHLRPSGPGSAAPAPPSIMTSPRKSATKFAPKVLAPKLKRSNSMIYSAPNGGQGSYGQVAGMMDTNSPLQRLERMELSLQAMNETSDQERADAETLARHIRLLEFGKLAAAAAATTGTATTTSKRDALHRVRTDAPIPFVRDMKGNPHANLPPTPDTVSSSTLNRLRNSSDTLAQEKGAAAGRTKTPTAVTAAAAASASFNTGFSHRLDIPPRPRSADETTISHRGHGSIWGDSDSSEGDDTDIDGNDSASLHDYWLRESLRPAENGSQEEQPQQEQQQHHSGRHHHQPHGHSSAMSGTQRSKGRRSGRLSPDLFCYPSTSNGWASTTMFGNLGGRGYHGSVRGSGSGPSNSNTRTGAAPLAETLDALGASLPAPASGLFGADGLLASEGMASTGSSAGGISSGGPPPPPHRRSSLHAQTGSTNGATTIGTVSRNPGVPGTPSGASLQSSPGGLSLSLSMSSQRKQRRTPSKALTTAGQNYAAAMARSGSQQDTRPASAVPQQLQQLLQQDQTGSGGLALPKQRHYPPASSTNSTAPRNRVLSLFRRSGSHEVSSAALLAASASAPASAPPTETTFSSAASAPAAGSASAPTPGDSDDAVIGIPSRVGRGCPPGDERNESSTPPPIMRNPRGSASVGTASETESKRSSTPLMPLTPTLPSSSTFSGPDGGDTCSTPVASTHDEASAAAAGPKKNWLGRVTSLRNRG